MCPKGKNYFVDVDAHNIDYLPGPSGKRRCVRDEKAPMMDNAAFVKMKKAENSDEVNTYYYVCDTCGDRKQGKHCEFFWGWWKQGYWIYCDDCMSRWRVVRWEQMRGIERCECAKDECQECP